MKIANTGKWFYFNPEDESEGGLKLRIPVIEETEEDGEDKFKWENIILDWNNVEDDDGVKIFYSVENLNLLMKTSPIFIAFANKFLSKFYEDSLRYKELLEKN